MERNPRYAKGRARVKGGYFARREEAKQTLYVKKGRKKEGRDPECLCCIPAIQVVVERPLKRARNSRKGRNPRQSKSRVRKSSLARRRRLSGRRRDDRLRALSSRLAEAEAEAERSLRGRRSVRTSRPAAAAMRPLRVQHRLRQPRTGRCGRRARQRVVRRGRRTVRAAVVQHRGRLSRRP